jgi:hypothetical protein
MREFATFGALTLSPRVFTEASLHQAGTKGCTDTLDYTKPKQNRPAAGPPDDDVI